MNTFKVTSGQIIISDPCYDPHSTGLSHYFKAKNGEWEAEVEHSDEGMWGNRVSVLRAHYTGMAKIATRSSGLVAVDSGQMCIFDMKEYQNKTRYKESDLPDGFWKSFDRIIEDTWYSMCCAFTCDTFGEEQKIKGAGLLEGGIVSRTGYGDGMYNCTFGFDENEHLIEVEVIFIEDEECDGCGHSESDCECCAACGQVDFDCRCDEEVCEHCWEYEENCVCCYECDEASTGECTCE